MTQYLTGNQAKKMFAKRSEDRESINDVTALARMILFDSEKNPAKYAALKTTIRACSLGCRTRIVGLKREGEMIQIDRFFVDQDGNVFVLVKKSGWIDKYAGYLTDKSDISEFAQETALLLAQAPE